MDSETSIDISNVGAVVTVESFSSDKTTESTLEDLEVIKVQNELLKNDPSSFYTAYKMHELLGSGGFGMVWVCEPKAMPGVKRAVKVVSVKKNDETMQVSEEGKSVPEEIKIWEQLQHPGIVALRAVYYQDESKNFFLVMDYDPQFVDLFEYVDSHGVLDNRSAATIVMQVIDVCYYLYRLGIDHRDIKDENILYNSQNRRIKLIDFGSASIITEQPFRRLQGTDVYIPPEFYNNNEYYSYEGTCWAIGCLAFTILNGDSPYRNRSEVAQCKQPRWLVDPVSLDPNALHFIAASLAADARKRIKISALSQHPWIVFSSYPLHIM